MSLIYTVPANVTGGGRHSLYIGGKVDAKNQQKLQQWGISHILNVTPTKEASIQVNVDSGIVENCVFTSCWQ